MVIKKIINTNGIVQGSAGILSTSLNIGGDKYQTIPPTINEDVSIPAVSGRLVDRFKA